MYIMPYPSKTGRQQILSAAMKLLARNGLRGVTVRAVASSLKIAPNALYRYFPDRKRLEEAVAAEAALRLHAVLLKATSRAHTGEQRIRMLAGTYMRFASEQHLLYEALAVPRPATGQDAVGPERLWQFAVEQVSRISGERAAPEATVALWAFLHGMAALQSANAFDEEKPFSSFEFGLQAWMDATKVAGASRKRNGRNSGEQRSEATARTRSHSALRSR
jgi:AcrR family transcriptional regulator